MLDAIQLVASRQFILPFDIVTRFITKLKLSPTSIKISLHLQRSNTGPLNIFLVFLSSKSIAGIFPTNQTRK